MAMMAQRRQWAQTLGVGPDMVEELFRNMVTRFIQSERDEWRSNHPPQPESTGSRDAGSSGDDGGA